MLQYPTASHALGRAIFAATIPQTFSRTIEHSVFAALQHSQTGVGPIVSVVTGGIGCIVRNVRHRCRDAGP
jgi:hypothetical protein